MAKTKKVDWVGIFSDPEYVKFKEEAIKSKNGLVDIINSVPIGTTVS